MEISIKTLGDGRYRIDEGNVTRLVRANPGETIEIAEGLFIVNKLPETDAAAS